MEEFLMNTAGALGILFFLVGVVVGLVTKEWKLAKKILFLGASLLALSFLVHYL